MKIITTEHVLGTIMIVIAMYTVAVLALALRNGSMHMAMRGGRGFDVTRWRNPIAFWVYFAISALMLPISIVGAYHFFGGRF